MKICIFLRPSWAAISFTELEWVLKASSNLDYARFIICMRPLWQFNITIILPHFRWMEDANPLYLGTFPLWSLISLPVRVSTTHKGSLWLGGNFPWLPSRTLTGDSCYFSSLCFCFSPPSPPPWSNSHALSSQHMKRKNVKDRDRNSLNSWVAYLKLTIL